MRFHNVAIETPVVVVPPVTVTSQELERMLEPAYTRAGLQPGRLELMTGIRERHFWNEGFRPSQGAFLAGKKALEAIAMPPEQIDCLINCSVSRDCVEPATSTFVHNSLGLARHALNFDISNACLGMMSGIVTLATMVESGMIDTGLVVAAENAGPLIKNTVQFLNNGDFTRQTIKPHFASLTIGSCAAAVIVRRKDQTQTGHTLLASAFRADTTGNILCQGDTAGGMTDSAAPLMQTDSTTLLHQGVAIATEMWSALKQETSWNEATPDLICTHQVGKGHRDLLYQTLGLDLAKDYSTFPIFGNCGSTSIIATLAEAARTKDIAPGASVALLGIGSGINCNGLALEW